MAVTDIYDAPEADLTAEEVQQWAFELKTDSGHEAMRTQMEKRHKDLVAMEDRPALAEHLLRAGIVVSMNSPLLGDLTDQVISDIRPFSTDITCVPMESGVERDCDELEKWFAVWKQTANPGWKHSRDFLWHLFLSSYAVSILKIRPDVVPDKEGKPQWADFPWEIIIPDPSTCYFPIEGAPFIPSVLAREYEMSVRTMEAKFAGAAGPFQTSMPLWKDGKVEILPIGDDYKVGSSGKYQGNAPRSENVTMIELMTPERTYIYCLDKTGHERVKADFNPRQGARGTLVWFGDNMTGCVPAVVGAGISTPLRTIPRERLQPAMRALYQDVKNLNRSWSTIATMAENAKPELINQKGAETIKAEARYTKSPTANLVNDGTGPAIIDLAGDRLLQWQHQEDKNVFEMAKHWDERTATDAARWRQLSDPEVLRDIKANVYLTSAESTRRSLSGVLTNYDFWWESTLSMAEASAHVLKREFPLWSSQDVVFGKAKKGNGSRKLSGGDLVTIDSAKSFKHTLNVATRSMSEAEQRMRREDMNARRAAGTATFMQELEIDYDDTEQQLVDLAIDRMLEHSEISFGAAEVDLAVQDACRFIGGVYIPIGGMGTPSPAVNQQAGATPGIGAPPMRPAMAGAAEGGSTG